MSSLNFVVLLKGWPLYPTLLLIVGKGKKGVVTLDLRKSGDLLPSFGG